MPTSWAGATQGKPVSSSSMGVLADHRHALEPRLQRHAERLLEVAGFQDPRLEECMGRNSAFKNPDGSLVAVMFNSGGAATYVVAIGGKNLQFSMPRSGWATVKYTP